MYNAKQMLMNNMQFINTAQNNIVDKPMENDPFSRKPITPQVQQGDIDFSRMSNPQPVYDRNAEILENQFLESDIFNKNKEKIMDLIDSLHKDVNDDNVDFNSGDAEKYMYSWLTENIANPLGKGKPKNNPLAALQGMM